MAGRRRRGPRWRRSLERVALALFAIACLGTATVNGLVRWVSGSGPFLLDPRHLTAKTRALFAYARHRPWCFIAGELDPARAVPQAAAAHGVDPDLLEALIQVESGSRAHRISPTGACGPAQLTLTTARQLGVRDPFEPREAIDGGARYLREQLDRFHGNRALALAAYNAGPGAVHGTIPVNGETEVYVPRVLAEWRALRRARGRDAPPRPAPVAPGPVKKTPRRSRPRGPRAARDLSTPEASAMLRRP